MKIPNLPTAKMVEEDGYPTSTELQYRQNLNQALQLGAGDSGLVAATQPAANIAQIQNNQDAQGTYTCQYGTILYNSTANSIMIAVNDGTNKPIFKTVTLT